MLDQLDDVRPPSFTGEHLQEMRRRARELRRHRRRNWSAAAALVVAATVSAVLYVAPRGHNRLVVSTVTGPPGPTSPLPTSSTLGGGPSPVTPGWPPAGAGSEVIFPLADSTGFVVVNLANRSATTIPLPGHAEINGFGLLPRTGGWVNYSGTTAYFWPTSLTGPGTDLGQAYRLLPALDPNQIWTMSQVRGPTPSDPVGPDTVKEVNTDGVTTAGPFTVPARSTPIGAVNGGLVLQTYNPSNTLWGLTLWNPQTGATRQLQPPVHLGNSLASGNVVAWTITDIAAGALGGQIDLLDLATNQLDVIHMGVGSPIPALGLLSLAPDGTQILALAGPTNPGVVGDTPPADYRDNAHVWIIDATTGTARNIGQISDPDGAAWSPNSQWVWEGLDGHLTALATNGHAAYSLPIPAPSTQNGTELSVR
jgi:hypothetical protein